MKFSSVRTLITATVVTALMSYGMTISAQTPGGQQQPPTPGSQQPNPQQPPRTTPPSQPSTPSTSSQTSASSPIMGELLEVDTAKMTLTIMNEKNSKETFTYTNATQVNNAAVAGLATMKNARVTVHFSEKSGVKTATRIEVRPASTTSPSAAPSPAPSTQPRPSTPPSGQPQNPPTPR